MIQFEVPTLFYDLLDDSLRAAAMTTPSRRCRPNNKCQRSSPFRHSLPHHRTYGKGLGKLFEAALNKAAAEQANVKSPAEKTPLTTTIERSDIFSKQFDLKHFTPAETTVKVDGNTLIVEGKHEKLLEDGTYEFREYRSRCTVPENVLLDKIKCKVNEHGQLQIEAPLKPEEEEEKPTGRIIPIEFVNQNKPPEAASDVQEITLD